MTTTQNKIVKIVYGSKLYGLETPTSDDDFYEVYQADIKDIILKKDVDCLAKDADNTQIKELRKFLYDAMKGQTYALEMLFAPKDKYIYSSEVWDFIVSNRDKLLSKNLRPFLAYAQNQAKTYSYKVHQLNKLEELKGEIKDLKDSSRIKDILSSITLNDTVKVTSDGRSEYLCVVNKEINVVLKVAHLKDALNRIHNMYGERTHKNKSTDYDPKAYSHALRLCYMLDELMTTGNISFPVVNREYLMQVKLGKMPVEQVRESLNSILDKIDKNMTVLPEEPDREFWDNYMIKLYSCQITSLAENHVKRDR